MAGRKLRKKGMFFRQQIFLFSFGYNKMPEPLVIRWGGVARLSQKEWFTSFVGSLLQELVGKLCICIDRPVAIINPSTLCVVEKGSASSVSPTCAPLHVYMDCFYLPSLICRKGKDLSWGLLERNFSFIDSNAVWEEFSSHIHRQAGGREMMFCLWWYCPK